MSDVIGPLAPGQAFEAEVTNFPAGIPDQVGFKIRYVATGAIVTPRQTGAVEGDPGEYFIGLTAPTLPGLYSVIADWAGGLEPAPSQTAQENLLVESVAILGAQLGQLDDGSAAVTVPHFSQPFRFVGGKAVVVEQDSIEEIRDCVATICRYRIGDRPEKPAFGIEDQTFAQNGPDTGLLTAQVSVWEPRAGIAAQLDGSGLEELVADVLVNVTDQGGAS